MFCGFFEVVERVRWRGHVVVKGVEVTVAKGGRESEEEEEKNNKRKSERKKKNKKEECICSLVHHAGIRSMGKARGSGGEFELAGQHSEVEGTSGCQKPNHREQDEETVLHKTGGGAKGGGDSSL